MKAGFDISDQFEIEVSDFNGQHDLAIKFKQPNGTWVTTGAVVISHAQAIALAVYLINQTPEAIKILKPKYLAEDLNEQRKSMIKRAPKIKPIRTLMDSLLQ
jgi:hypothetical protein